MKPEHSHIGASGMHRWSVCPGSVRVVKGLPNCSTYYAAEGTVAHDLAAKALQDGADPAARFGETVMCEGYEVLVTAEMVEGVAEYVSYVKELAAVPKAELLVEHRFDLSVVHGGLYGTADAVVWHPVTRTLIVADFKFGAGKPVEAEGNPQLDYYALGALLTCGYTAEVVRKVIVQPRCPHPKGSIRQHDILAIDLLDFRADLLAYAMETEAPDAKLVSGDHCRFCPAAGVCPELHRVATAQAVVEFNPAKVYDPAALALALGNLPVLEAYIKNLREFAYREAEAGRTPPGYKLVAKRATRQWKSEGDVVEALQDLGVAPEVIYEPREVRSPAQMEKALGKGGKDFVSQFVESVSSGHTLVPESDPRPPAKPLAIEEFSVVQTT